MKMTKFDIEQVMSELVAADEFLEYFRNNQAVVFVPQPIESFSDKLERLTAECV